MPQQKVVVVVPVYKVDLNRWEVISLQQCVRILGNGYTIVFVAPESLDTRDLERRFGIGHVERFADDFFVNIAGYNRLMLSPVFYERFLDYEYLLIYQLDAYVFSDQLDDWCDRGYDYVGAPWVPSDKYNSIIHRNELRIYQLFMRLIGSYASRSNYFYAGNGGFSLRRVTSCLDVVKSDPEEIESFLAHDSSHYAEDIYWSIRANRIRRRLRIPHFSEALEFAFENHPKYMYECNGRKLPFGTHAWYKGVRLDFWRHFIDISDAEEANTDKT